MNLPHIAALFPTTVTELPEPRPTVAVDDTPAPGELTGYRRELFDELSDEMTRQSEVVVAALAALGETYRKNSDSVLERWCQDPDLRKLLSVVVELPREAATGAFKISGMIPKAIDADAATKFEALIVLYAARAIFFAERRGIHGVLDAVHARRPRYEPYLTTEELLVIDGFPTLFSLLADPSITVAMYTFASSAWRAFSEETRALMCLGATR